MRYRSLFWPFTLIAAGAMWLLIDAGRIPRENLWALAHFWPVLLIGLGCSLILRAYWAPAGPIISALVVIAAVLSVIYAPQLGWAGVPNWGFSFGDGVNFNGGVQGSGKIVTQTRNLGDFTAIDIRYPTEVLVVQGDHDAVDITADDNLVPQLLTDISNGKLTFENSVDDFTGRVNPSQTVKIKITVKNLNEVDFSSAGKVTVQNLETDSLSISLSGAGDVVLDHLTTGQLESRVSGSGDITANGTATDIDLHISGLGNFSGGDLHGQTANVQISGAGSGTLWVDKDLNVQVSGAGSVSYYGSPTLEQSISGVGSVDKIGIK